MSYLINLEFAPPIKLRPSYPGIWIQRHFEEKWLEDFRKEKKNYAEYKSHAKNNVK